MFNFKNYPELKKCHKEYQSLRNAMYKAEARYDRSGSDEDNKLCENSINETQSFITEIYSQVVYNILIKVKPLLYNLRLKKDTTWESVFGKSFINLSTGERKGLVALIEENGGIYRLPPEYYK
ncbi:MAG: hypothetical protein K2J80_02105 [Oscillospiraceae bacterium]|nr:hypothetical protein [Oscillospiraceae bacterium]